MGIKIGDKTSKTIYLFFFILLSITPFISYTIYSRYTFGFPFLILNDVFNFRTLKTTVEYFNISINILVNILIAILLFYFAKYNKAIKWLLAGLPVTIVLCWLFWFIKLSPVRDITIYFLIDIEEGIKHISQIIENEYALRVAVIVSSIIWVPLLKIIRKIVGFIRIKIKLIGIIAGIHYLITGVVGYFAFNFANAHWLSYGTFYSKHENLGKIVGIVFFILTLPTRILSSRFICEVFLTWNGFFKWIFLIFISAFYGIAIAFIVSLIKKYRLKQRGQ